MLYSYIPYIPSCIYPLWFSPGDDILTDTPWRWRFVAVTRAAIQSPDPGNFNQPPPNKGLINHGFPLIRPYYTLFFSGGVLGWGKRLTRNFNVLTVQKSKMTSRWKVTKIVDRRYIDSNAWVFFIAMLVCGVVVGIFPIYF